MKRLTLLAVGLLAFSGVASAGDVVGAGNHSCGEYFKYSKDNSSMEIVYTSWAQGALTGFNLAEQLHGVSRLDIPDADAIKLYMDNWCQAHPLDGYGVGVATLFHDLRQRQKTTAKP